VGEVLYLHPAVAAATRAGEKTYSLHDTHWTGYGAYAGYAALVGRLHALGLTDAPLPLSAFQKVGLGRRGPRDLALMLGVSSFVDLDFPHFDNLPGEAKIDVTYLGPKTDWTAPQVIDTRNPGKPVLLMTRDSFSNELLPFLYPHFSRIVLAHNQDGFWRPDLIDRFKPDLVLLEVIEPGLRVGMGDGPRPSPEALSRIDRALGSAPAAAHQGPMMPNLPAAAPAIAAALASAKPTDNCNLERASLDRGQGEAATLTVSGWLSELGDRVTSPDGLAALKGPGGVFAAPLKVDRPRPDVAVYYKKPTGRESGFTGAFFVARLPAGAYTPMIARRSPEGWIACVGKAALVVP
jgi:hypothetical protein